MPPPRSSRVLLDLNSPQFQETLFDLELSELRQVISALRRLRGQDWKVVYSHTGFHWEAIGHIETPNGAKAYSIRLSQRIRAIAYRHGDYLRLVSLHPDHDSAYRR
ncbi:MAG TPA: hypothetical protein VHG32_18850 [Thermoanaerobaculia bacterium]|nr:hypothetical protein [Thermoanaerobaculia bacterium]